MLHIRLTNLDRNSIGSIPHRGLSRLFFPSLQAWILHYPPSFRTFFCEVPSFFLIRSSSSRLRYTFCWSAGQKTRVSSESAIGSTDAGLWSHIVTYSVLLTLAPPAFLGFKLLDASMIAANVFYALHCSCRHNALAHTKSSITVMRFSFRPFLKMNQCLFLRYPARDCFSSRLQKVSAAMWGTDMSVCVLSGTWATGSTCLLLMEGSRIVMPSPASSYNL